MNGYDETCVVEIGALHTIDLVEVAVNLGDPPGELDHVAAADALLVSGAEGARGAVHEVGAEGVRGLALLGLLNQVLAAQPGKVASQVLTPSQILRLKEAECAAGVRLIIFQNFRPFTRIRTRNHDTTFLAMFCNLQYRYQ